MLRLRGTPDAVARGFAVGLLVAFTPTIGLQLILAAAIATLLRASRPAALIPVWITNPATIPAIYTFTYNVGSWFWRGPVPSLFHAQLDKVVERISNSRWHELGERLNAHLEFGADIFVSLWIGGILVGGIAAAVSYPLVRSATKRLLLRRAKRRAHRGGRVKRRVTVYPPVD